MIFLVVVVGGAILGVLQPHDPSERVPEQRLPHVPPRCVSFGSVLILVIISLLNVAVLRKLKVAK